MSDILECFTGNKKKCQHKVSPSGHRTMQQVVGNRSAADWTGDKSPTRCNRTGRKCTWALYPNYFSDTRAGTGRYGRYVDSHVSQLPPLSTACAFLERARGARGPALGKTKKKPTPPCTSLVYISVLWVPYVHWECSTPWSNGTCNIWVKWDCSFPFFKTNTARRTSKLSHLPRSSSLVRDLSHKQQHTLFVPSHHTHRRRYTLDELS